MKNHMFTLLALLFIVPMAFALIGCGSSGGGDGAGGVSVVGIDLVSSDAIGNGTSAQFQAWGLKADGTLVNLTNTVSWSSMVTDVATVSKGIVTGMEEGDTIIVISYKGDVESSKLSVEDITDVTVIPLATAYAPGTTVQLRADAYLSSGGKQDVTTQVEWVSGTPGAATVSTSGLLTAVAATDDANEQTTTVTATISSGGADVIGTVAYDVAEPAAVTILRDGGWPFEPQTALVGTSPRAMEVSLTAFAGGLDQVITTTNANLVFTSDDTAVMTVDASTGVANMIAASTAVTAGTFSFSYNALTGTGFIVDSVGGLGAYAVGDVIYVTGSANGNDGVYTLSAVNVDFVEVGATVLTDEVEGANVTITNAVTATATWTTAAATPVTDTVSLIAVDNAVDITISGDPGNLDVGESVQLGATANFADRSTQTVTDKVTWAETSASATISATGLLTGDAVGWVDFDEVTAVLGTATSTGLSVESIAVVAAPVLTAFAITLTDKQCTDALALPHMGGENGVMATATTYDYVPPGCPGLDACPTILDGVTFTSSDSSVVDVFGIDAGGMSMGILEGITNGTATIGAMVGALANTAALDIIVVEITDLTNVNPVDDAMAITAPDVTEAGQGSTVSGVYTGGTCSMQDYVTWASDDEGIAIVSNENGTNGFTIAIGAGVANISAIFNGLSASDDGTVSVTGP